MPLCFQHLRLSSPGNNTTQVTGEFNSATMYETNKQKIKSPKSHKLMI